MVVARAAVRRVLLLEPRGGVAQVRGRLLREGAVRQRVLLAHAPPVHARLREQQRAAVRAGGGRHAQRPDGERALAEEPLAVAAARLGLESK